MGWIMGWLGLLLFANRYGSEQGKGTLERAGLGNGKLVDVFCMPLLAMMLN